MSWKIVHSFYWLYFVFSATVNFILSVLQRLRWGNKN